MTEISLAAALAQATACARWICRRRIDTDVARSIPQVVAMKALVVPLSRVGQRFAGSCRVDPVDVVGLDDVRLHLHASTVASNSKWWWPGKPDPAAFGGHLERGQRGRRLEASTTPAKAAPSTRRQGRRRRRGGRGPPDPRTAIRMGASDIHIEPMAEEVRVRMRVDGGLRKVMTLPCSGQAPLTSRIKIICQPGHRPKKVPQDGRARIRLDGGDGTSECRPCPTLHGETLVIRLLADIGELPALTALGIPGDMLSRVHQALRSNRGLVLITGPTGSGKTTTLSAIHEVVTGDRNLITLEEPVEIELPGVSQVQIDEKSGMTFAASLRSVLRQDPDIIMVGEIRDKVTAELAIRAALTGHLVLATVRTPSTHLGSDATDRHGCASVPDRLVADHGDRTTSGTQALYLLQGA